MRLQPFIATLALYVHDNITKPTPVPTIKTGLKGRQQGFEVPKPTEWQYLVFQ